MAEGRTGERATGTPNEIYDLTSVLFHALEGGASYDQYIRDAEEAGDEELVDFFTRVRDEDSMRADEAQRLLAERTPTAERTGGMTTGATAGTEEGPLGGAERGDALGREDPPLREERARETEREEDKGLIDRALDKLSGREDEERRREEERRER